MRHHLGRWKQGLGGTWLAGVLWLGGCMTLQDSKSVVLPPAEHAVVVTSFAQTFCQAYFFFTRCELRITTEAAP